MGGKMSRSKGQRGEREVRDLFRAAGFWAERGRSQSAGGGAEDPDVRTDCPGIHVECKHTERVSKQIYQWFEQARRDAGSELAPVLFMRRNGEQWLAVMDAREWLELAGVACNLPAKDGAHSEDEQVG